MTDNCHLSCHLSHNASACKYDRAKVTSVPRTECYPLCHKMTVLNNDLYLVGKKGSCFSDENGVGILDSNKMLDIHCLIL